MKKIIDGKKYDTETATLIGTYEYGNYGDFHFCREELYRKRTKEFFLFGEGGALSKYSKSLGNGAYGWGETITPYSDNSAREWVENYCDVETYEELFGEVEE